MKPTDVEDEGEFDAEIVCDADENPGSTRNIETAQHPGLRVRTDLSDKKRNSTFGTGRQMLTDGGHVDSSTDADTTRERVTRYVNDSDITVFREADQHVVVIDEGTSRDNSVMRVPANRTATVAGETLWVIPSNWEPCFRVRERPVDKMVFRIPETSAIILVRLPHTDQGERTYEVEKIGSFYIRPANDIDAHAYDDAIAERRNQDESDADLVEALINFQRGWMQFSYEYRVRLQKEGEQTLIDEFYSSKVPTYDSWEICPWDEDQDYRLRDIVRDVSPSREYAEDIFMVLMESGALLHRPRMRVRISEYRDHWLGYEVQALIEAGCSPGEAIDYIAVDVRDEAVTSWANTRGVAESIIEENVATARAKLNE